MEKRPTPTDNGAVADDRLLTTRELLERIPLNRSTVWRMVLEGRFPAPVRLSTSRNAWRWSTVLAWLADREAHPIKQRAYFAKKQTPSTEPVGRATA